MDETTPAGSRLPRSEMARCGRCRTRVADATLPCPACDHDPAADRPEVDPRVVMDTRGAVDDVRRRARAAWLLLLPLLIAILPPDWRPSPRPAVRPPGPLASDRPAPAARTPAVPAPSGPPPVASTPAPRTVATRPGLPGYAGPPGGTRNPGGSAQAVPVTGVARTTRALAVDAYGPASARARDLAALTLLVERSRRSTVDPDDPPPARRTIGPIRITAPATRRTATPRTRTTSRSGRRSSGRVIPVPAPRLPSSATTAGTAGRKAGPPVMPAGRGDLRRSGVSVTVRRQSELRRAVREQAVQQQATRLRVRQARAENRNVAAVRAAAQRAAAQRAAAQRAAAQRAAAQRAVVRRQVPSEVVQQSVRARMAAY